MVKLFCIVLVREEVLVSDFKADVTIQDKYYGRTPLHSACNKGHLDVVRVLVSEFKADVTIQDNDGCTPLHYACLEGHLWMLLVQG